MIKILLVSMPVTRYGEVSKTPFPPLGMSELAGYIIEKGHEVTCLDLEPKIYGLSKENKDCLWLFNEIEDNEKEEYVHSLFCEIDIAPYDIIGFSITYESQKELCKNLARRIKAIDPSKKVVVGGRRIRTCDISFDDELKKGSIDYIIEDWGEKPFLQLIINLEEGNLGYELIDGLAYIKDGNLQKNTRKNIVLDRGNNKHYIHTIRMAEKAIPFYSSYNLSEYAKHYDKSTLKEVPSNSPAITDSVVILPYRMHFGCTGYCNFCTPLPQQYDYKKPSQSVREIGILKKKHNSRYFAFLNMQHNLSNDLALEFCEELIHQDVQILWSDSFRAQSISDKLIIKLREAGCIKVVLGLESASQKILNFMGKATNVAEYEDLLKKFHKNGIWVAANFIVGFPGENISDIEQSKVFFNKNLRYIDEIYNYGLYITKSMDIYRNPDHHSIKIKDPVHTTDKDAFTFSYDEINGLSWEEKKAQNELHNSVIVQLLKDNSRINRLRDNWNPLFYLYDRLEQKETIRHFLSEHTPQELGY